MIIIKNKKAFFNYNIEKIYEAGIILKGWEVKSIKLGMSQIKKSYIKVFKNEIFILNFYIGYTKKFSKFEKIETNRTKKLLLNSKQIKKITEKITFKGYTVIPLDLHYKKSFIKSKIGIAKGKKQYDKREIKKKQDIQKYIQNKIKNSKIY